ncbi:uncharacterized protein N7477_004899 [Penicillium maclennaniae]|uniref:uncharacterized protein n=1 Tax=Penicillium maclennaniae TaxID=1343394 RepID=UPI00254220ED|nr:uncharacterized protein N7477_004899 [Penicillium maclennaniae]KAJ5674965.1 hypothetical protein N7477_004899 [Penicillium maclennaniae]
MAEMFTADAPHLLPYLNPAVSVGLYTFSTPIVPRRPDSTSLLSIAGLASQAMVHVILAVSWALMVRPRLDQILTFVWPALIMSYNFFWWPMVDNTVFAVLQGRLLWKACREKKVVASEDRHEWLDGDEKAELPGTV